MAHDYSRDFANGYIRLCRTRNYSYIEEYRHLESVWNIMNCIETGTMSMKEALHTLGIGRNTNDKISSSNA